MSERFEQGQTVYLADGREAEYVIANGDQHLVRVIHEVDGSYDEPPYSYPSGKITPAHDVYATAPVEVWDRKILAARKELDALQAELASKRNEIASASRAKADMEKAAAKYPCIQQALDFIEGRITHVVNRPEYGAATIHTMPEAFEALDTWGGRKKHEGMKLLSLFGTDESGRKCAWGLHQYRDGSGSSTTQIFPAHSEDDAKRIVRDLVEDAIEAWRSGDDKWQRGKINVPDTFKKNPWLTVPDDWAAYQKRKEAEARDQKIEKLRSEIAELEAMK